MASPSRQPSPGLGAVLGAAAVAVGAAALANYAVARRSERRNPPTGRFIEVDSVRLHVIERGTEHTSGTPVVLLHGNGTMAQDYALSGVLDLVARNHRVIAFDRPGFGYSERPRDRLWTARAQAELLHAALRHLGVQRPVLVGHSWGTLVALTMALDHPRDTAGLVMLSGYYVPSARLDVPLLMGPALPGLGDLLRYTISPLLGLLLSPLLIRKSFAPSKVPERFKRDFPLGLSLRPWQIRASAGDTALMIPGALATVGRHTELRMPVVIVAGTGDKIVDSQRQSGHLHHDVPGSVLHELPGAGHMIQHIAPERVAAAVEEACAAAEARLSRTGVPPAATDRHPALAAE